MCAIRIIVFLLCSAGTTSDMLFGQVSDSVTDDPHVYHAKQVDSYLQKPVCLQGYFTNQTGYLTKVDSSGSGSFDTTFSVEQIKILSNDVYINGWLYVPFGDEKYPLVVLTNGGGNITRNNRSFSDWMAPILAHCGIAAFVHDKRGTGASEGIYRNTTYEDYITDAGNCAVYLSKHERINPGLIGVAGASEGGRIAVIAASRYPEIKFVISFEGTVVSSVDDRIHAQTGWLKSLNLPDSTFRAVLDLHEKSIRAWASNEPGAHKKLQAEIYEMREKYDARLLPFPKEEMDSIPAFDFVLPTWYSLPFDYMSEMQYFSKKWLAIFGEEDQVVPTAESVKNIIYYMKLSGNADYNIAIIPDCGHGVISTKTNRIIRVDNMIIHWIKGNVLSDSEKN
jgi:uncharacterized protein